MAFTKRNLSLGHIERFVFRPLFVFFTFLMVLLAIFQASGRFAMASLSLFEAEINTALNTQSISVDGLRGDWRGLNPVIFIERLQFPAGTVTAIEAELDVLESMLRSAPVARLLAFEQATLFAEQSASGAWRLRGLQPAGRQLDVADSLWHSDELRGRVELHLHSDQGGDDKLTAQVRMANRGGMHHADLLLQNPLHDATLNAEAWQRDALWPVQRDARALRLDGALLLPAALTGMNGLMLEVSEGHYADADGFGDGHLALTLNGVALPASAEHMAAGVSLTLARDARRWFARADDLTTEIAGEAFSFEPIYLQGLLPEEETGLQAAAEFIAETPSQPLLSLWLANLDLAELGGYFQRHFGAWEPAGRWVSGLSVSGLAHNLQGFYDPELGLGYMASLSDMRMQGYKGAPTVRNVSGQLWGHSRAIAMQVRGTDAYLGFPDLYTRGWNLDRAQGVIKAWFSEGYFGIRGTHLRASMGDTEVGGGFSISRPDARYEQRLSLEMAANSVDLALGKTLVPYKVPDALRDWLASGPRAGRLSNARFVMHGQVHLRPNELGRRLELIGDISEGRVEYAAGWPEVVEVQGRLHVAGVETRVQVDSAVSQQVQIGSSQIVLHDNSTYVSGELTAVADMGAALDFVRVSPLQENLNFVTPGWQGSGQLTLRGNLNIPINAETAPPLSVDLDYDVDGVSLAMPDYRVVAHRLQGSGTFSLPHHMAGEFSASLFDAPARVRARYNDDWLFFDIDGRAAPADVYRLLETQEQVPIDGDFAFSSVLSLAMRGGVTNLFVESDLEGLSIDLPGPFAKPAETAEPGDLNVQFLNDYQSVSWRYRDVRGWLHYGDGIERGALGIGVPPPTTAQTERAIVIAGRMPRLVLSDWVSTEGDSAVTLPLDWMIRGLDVDEFVIDELTFADLVLTGSQRGDLVEFGFDGPTVKGRVQLPGALPMRVDLDYLQLGMDDEASEAHIGAPQVDPITVAVGQSLPAAVVNVAQLQLGEDPFGAWRFEIVPGEDRVEFEDFGADVNGVHIEDSTLAWDLREDVSSFSGRVRLDDLEETLPKWDYAPSLSSDKARLLVNLNWQGSPLNYNLVGTSGSVDFEARDGRFIEVDSSASGLRILGLLNFTKVARRISFDFSDVTGEGLSYDKIEAKVDLHAGELTFPRRMKVETSSGNFQVGGRVDLRSGELDNEMIVTLPVSKSLPWYGVYLALANPLAGLGVVVGERVLRKPIEQFSTAKFEVTGTLEDPEVKFVSLWDQSMKEVDMQQADDSAHEADEQPSDKDTLPGDNTLGAVTDDAAADVRQRPVE